MADAVLDRAGGPQPDDRADSGYAVSPVPAGPDGRPPRPGVPVGPGSVMTEAPARRREQPRPAGSAPAPPPADAITPAPADVMARGRWGRVGWLFAAIWLVYLAQPVGVLWTNPD